MKNLAKSIIIIFICFYLWISFWLYGNQEKFIFHENKWLNNTKYQERSWEYKWITIYGLDNIYNWCNKNIIFFHWNWWNIYTHKSWYDFFTKNNYCFITIDYLWYWKNTWHNNNEYDLYWIWDLVYNHALNKWFNNKKIITRWYSLWWWIASYIWLKYQTNSMILQSSYTSIYELSNNIFPVYLFPIKYILKYKLNTYDRLSKYKWNLFIIHGNKDETINVNYAYKNYNIYKWNKKIYIFTWWHADDIFKSTSEIKKLINNP